MLLTALRQAALVNNNEELVLIPEMVPLWLSCTRIMGGTHLPTFVLTLTSLAFRNVLWDVLELGDVLSSKDFNIVENLFLMGHLITNRS